MRHSQPPEDPVAGGAADQQQLLAAGVRREGRSDRNVEAIANPFLLLFHLYNIKRLGFHSLISTGFLVLLKPGTAKKSQQKCIVIFALVCCFAILVALIFSAVDIMGEDEDGLSEKNCQNKCRTMKIDPVCIDKIEIRYTKKFVPAHTVLCTAKIIKT
ncbi:hypothetical protein MJG53_011045 [Ovis ammon polii x Ovis aries]|uniref:Uncharacterized protein n=1 Tax=Ovis ammon polii x Ovis aries TaxID=2918886 RepID=A0ACB9URK3_9CETA|nr:hypothetical protein MJG53_011045 [Ovis ammon polii x Ovis aries]